jgi:hypothetical protein
MFHTNLHLDKLAILCYNHFLNEALKQQTQTVHFSALLIERCSARSLETGSINKL